MESRLLLLQRPALDRADIFIPGADDSYWHQQKGNLQYKKTPVNHRYPVFLIPPEAMNGEDIYVRVSSVSLFFQYSFSSVLNFAEQAAKEQLFYGLILGALIVMTFYSLVLFSRAKDRLYILLAVNLLVTGVYISNLYGVTSFLFGSHIIVARTTYLWIAVFCVAYSLLVRQYLLPCLISARLLLGLAGLCVVLGVIHLTSPQP